MSLRQKERALENWEKKRIAIDQARRVRSLRAAGNRVPDNPDNEHGAAATAAFCNIPTMPVLAEDSPGQPHRDKLDGHPLAQPSLVTRPISNAEMARLPAAMKAVQDEWDKLRAMGGMD